MTLLQDFENKWGEEEAEEIINRAGLHSKNAPKEGDTERLVFGLLEILDFECNKYEDFSGISDDEIKAFLLDHKAEVLALDIEPSSYIGLMCGIFSFLTD